MKKKQIIGLVIAVVLFTMCGMASVLTNTFSQNFLAENGLKGEKIEEISTKVEAGVVIKQEIKEGEKIEKGSSDEPKITDSIPSGDCKKKIKILGLLKKYIKSYYEQQHQKGSKNLLLLQYHQYYHFCHCLFVL